MANLPSRARIALAACLAAASIVAGAGCGDTDDASSTTVPPTSGASGEQGEAQKPAAEANEEGSGSGLEQDLSGSDVEGSDTSAGQEATTGDETAE